MKVITTSSGATILYYADIKEMPAKRHKEFNKELLKQSGIGSDMKGVDDRFGRLMAFMAEGQIKEAHLEIENLYFNHYAIINKLDFRSTAFACLVHSINDKEYKDLSEEGLERTVLDILETDVTVGDIENAIEVVKKK